MEKVGKKGAAMDEVEGNSSSSSVLKISIVNKFKKELEKSGMIKFSPKLEGILSKSLDDCLKESQFSVSNPLSQLTEDVGSTRPAPVLEQWTEATLRPLVFLFQNPGNECVMGMMINGKPEVVKNEEGSRSTPAYAGYASDEGLVYGTDAERYSVREDQLWQGIQSWEQFFPRLSIRSIDLKEHGIFDLPRLFFMGYLFRKLKITAEKSQGNGGLCQVAILTVPMKTKCVKRLRLKEAAMSAGFKDVSVITAEGLAAFYWFHEKGREMERNNFSKDHVIINLFGSFVVYKRSLESGIDGKKILVVKAVILLDNYHRSPKEMEEVFQIIKEQLKICEADGVIPIISREEHSSFLKDNSGIKAAVVEDDKEDEFKYFAVKGAALLSDNPGKIGRQIRNMIGTTVRMGASSKGMVTRPDCLLPETIVRRTWNVKHYSARYPVSQIGIGVREDEEIIGCLAVNGVKAGAELKVTCELNWEGILKVVGVSAKNLSEDEEDNKAVKWDWVLGDDFDSANFGSSYEECRSLLMKILPSPSQAKVADTEGHFSGGLPPQALDEAVEASGEVCSSGEGNKKGKKTLRTILMDALRNAANGSKDKVLKKVQPSTSQVKGRSTRLTKVGATTSGSGCSQDPSVGLGSSSNDTGDGNGMQDKKRTRKGRVIGKNDIIVNPMYKKVKLESDWVEPPVVVKIEQGSMEGYEEGGRGQQVNFEEDVKIEVEEGVVKIEVVEEEDDDE